MKPPIVTSLYCDMYYSTVKCHHVAKLLAPELVMTKH